MTEYPTASYRSDTGLWHLTVKVSDHGLSAFLNLKDSETEPPRTLVAVNWPKDRDGLMAKIENTVYDHPEVLDDYSATIIVESNRTLAVPPEILKEEGDAERLYTMVYKSHPEDVISDDTGKEAILFTLIPGMISFLRRTFPGARVRSHLSLLIEKVRKEYTGLRIYLNLRQGEADIIAMNGESLLSASVQPWREWTDIAYRVMNLIDVYGLPANECDILIEGAEPGSFDSLNQFLVSKGGCASVRRGNLND